MPIKIIKDQMHGIHIHFIFGENEKKTMRYIDSKTDINYNINFESAGCAFGEKHDYFIVIPDTEKTWAWSAILAHEALHVASRILRRKGVVLCDESEESFTYYLSWLMQSMIDIYNKHQTKNINKLK